MTDTTPPLSGLKVVEMTHALAGPVCGLMLADMGADVVKVERFPGGDVTRTSMRPPGQGESAAFRLLNRNKRSLAVDLKQAEGVNCLKTLLQNADIFIENFRPGTLKRLGIDYDELKRGNPGLLYCQITGFGINGPAAQLPGFDLIAQGMSGIISITGNSTDQQPIRCGPPVTDIAAAVLASMAILAAYIKRCSTGQGQRIDTSIFEAGIIQTYLHSASFFTTGKSPAPTGAAHLLSAPYEIFCTSDGWITIGAATEENWQRLLKTLNDHELAADPRFENNASRLKNRAELAERINKIFATNTTAHWLQQLHADGVPAGAINSIGDMLSDPQTLAREMLIEVPAGEEQKAKAIGCPVKFSETPLQITGKGAPSLGEHTHQVLLENGLEEEDIQQLDDAKVIHCG